MKSLHLKRSVLFLTLAYLAIQNKAYSQASENTVSQRAERPYKIGILGSNFIKFNTDEMIDMVSRLNIHYLSVKEKHLPFESTNEQIAEFHQKLAGNGIIANSVGLFYLNKQEEIDRVFDYAKRVGVDLIVGVPQYELLPYVEQKVREYNIMFAIHVHGGDVPMFPNAVDVIAHIKDLDTRIGVCLDMGHEMRGGSNPAESLRKYKERILDIQLKDVTAADKTGRSCVIGQGVLHIPDFVKMLTEVGYAGTCSFELEENRKDPLPGLAESKGYFEAVEDMLTHKF